MNRTEINSENEPIFFEFIDIASNLKNFDSKGCKVCFEKPSDRRRIIEDANRLFKKAFENFKDSLNPEIKEVYLLIEAFEEKKAIKDFKTSELRELFLKREEISEMLNYMALAYLEEFFSASPSLQLFSPSFHEVKRILIKSSLFIKLNEHDLLPKQQTQWNSDRKLFTYLIARKRYLFECWQFLMNQFSSLSRNLLIGSGIYTVKLHWNMKLFMNRFQVRDTVLYLISKGLVNEQHSIVFAKMIYGIHSDVKIKWLGTIKELVFLFLQLEQHKYIVHINYWKYGTYKIILDTYFTDSKDRAINIQSIRYYFSKYKDNECLDYQTNKNNSYESEVFIFLKTLKLKNGIKY